MLAWTVGCLALLAAAPGGQDSAAAAWAFPVARISVTYGANGMVVSTDRVASEVGAEIMRRGGNAVDAAVATQFALAVVNPEAGNIGGGGFMIIRMADGRAAALDFRETAPRGARRDMFLDANGDVTNKSLVGHLASGVPGSVAGMWEAHQRFGSMQWTELVAPAINLAQGIVVHARLAESLRTHETRLRTFPGTARVFLTDGRAPRVGDRLAQPGLAETLGRVAAAGRDGFYRGRTAELIAAEMRRGGGLITADDLERYAARWRQPVSTTYRAHTVLSMPPPSSGGVTIAEILNVLEGYDLSRLGHFSDEHVHLWTEAVKRAYADRNTYLGDPDFVRQPADVLASKPYAAARRAEIRLDRATPSSAVRPGLGLSGATAQGRPEGQNTTHFSVVDAAGNAVSVTTTINSLYGSLVTVEGAGFLMNNEMDDFASKPGVANQFGLVQGDANAIVPGKRMLSSMTPLVVLAPDGRVKLVSGTPGGATIVTTMAQMVSDIVDFQMDLASATAAPRLHHQHLPDVLLYEPAGLPAALVSALRDRGHSVQELTVQGRPAYQGDTQSILLTTDGTLIGVSDPRRGGAAVAVEGARDVVQ